MLRSVSGLIKGQSRAEVLFDHRQCDKLIKMPTDWES